MHSFSIVAITNYHKVSGLKQEKYGGNVRKMAGKEIPAFLLQQKQQLDSYSWMTVALRRLKNPTKNPQQHSGTKKAMTQKITRGITAVELSGDGEG